MKNKTIHGILNPKIHTKNNPLVMKSYTTKGLPTLVKWFVVLVSNLYGLNKPGTSDEIIEEITRQNI